MSTFFHKSFAVAERKAITVTEVAERVAGAIEHPFVAARSYVKDVGIEWVTGLLTASARRRLDRQRKSPYRWEAGATCTDAAKVFFMALYRPGFLPEQTVMDHFGPDLGAVILDLGRSSTNTELISLLDLPNEGALYKVASAVRTDERYAELPRRREWVATEEQKQQIAEMLEARRPYSDIAREVGTTVPTIREHIRASGLTPNRVGRRANEERNERLAAEYRQGKSPKLLAEEYGISAVRVHQIVRATAPNDMDTYKSRVRALLSTYPIVPDDVEYAIQTLLAWAEE